jgi:GTP:adenosylcobinamide-phosphate guanylyltransferase
MTLPGGTTAIVMAGRREGHVDPLAAAAGLADKCVVPVAGRPMIGHVLATLGSTPEIGRVIVSVNDAAVLDDVVEVADLRAQGRLVVTPARTNLVDSLLAAVDEAAFPIFITTADNVLLSPAASTEFFAGAAAAGADVAVAFARRHSVLAAHPEGQRRFYRFADDSYSNCNSYWIGDAGALAIAEVFRGGGQFAKHPLRIVQAFGLLNLIRFRYGIGTLDEAFRRFSRRFTLAVRAVILSDGAVAIDVDNPRTLAVAEAVFAERNITAQAPVPAMA